MSQADRRHPPDHHRPHLGLQAPGDLAPRRLPPDHHRPHLIPGQALGAVAKQGESGSGVVVALVDHPLGHVVLVNYGRGRDCLGNVLDRARGRAHALRF